MRALFTLTVFCSAFTLFIIEPIAAKMILPTFGGSASVWTAAMVFFQLALLGGYAYANWLWKRPAKSIFYIHFCLAWLAIFLLVVSIHSGWLFRVSRLGAGAHPSAFAVALVLAELIGLPFFVLSASSPMLQRAFARTNDPKRRNPYFLYAAGNAGSLMALLAYPVVIEPFFSLWRQFAVWFLLMTFALLAGSVCLIAVSPRKAALNVEDPVLEETESESTPSWRQRMLWIALAAGPSSLLLGVTTFLTTSVAPIPLLWVVPLSLYLVTFIVAFAHKARVSATGVGRSVPSLPPHSPWP